MGARIARLGATAALLVIATAPVAPAHAFPCEEPVCTVFVTICKPLAKVPAAYNHVCTLT